VVRYRRKPLSEIMGVSFPTIERSCTTRNAATAHRNWKPCRAPTDIYKRDREIERYNVPVLRHPDVSFDTSGMPGSLHFLYVPQTISGTCLADRRPTETGAGKEQRSAIAANERIFFDDDTLISARTALLFSFAGQVSEGAAEVSWSFTARGHSDYER